MEFGEKRALSVKQSWGLNLLGRALMDVRRILREEEQEREEQEGMKMDGEEENVMMEEP